MTLSADDRALLREVFRAAHAKGWTRHHNDRDFAEPGSRYWSDDRYTVVELDKNGWVKTPISEVECVTVQLAVDVLVAVGVLPMHMSFAYQAAEEMAYGAVREQVRLIVAEWYDDLRAPAQQCETAEKVGYLTGVAGTVNQICDVIGDEHPLWDDMRQIAEDAKAGAR